MSDDSNGIIPIIFMGYYTIHPNTEIITWYLVMKHQTDNAIILRWTIYWDDSTTWSGKHQFFNMFFRTPSTTQYYSWMYMNVTLQCVLTHAFWQSIFTCPNSWLSVPGWFNRGKKKHGNMSQNHSNTKGLGLDALSNPTSIISWWSKHPYLHPWTNHQNIQTKT